MLTNYEYDHFDTQVQPEEFHEDPISWEDFEPNFEQDESDYDAMFEQDYSEEYPEEE